MAGIAAGVVVLAVCLLFSVYVTRTATWDDIFARVGLNRNTAKPGQTIQLADGEAAVHFLDVGQADCTVIRAGRTVVMIDAGDWYASAAIVDFLDRYGITRVDHFFLTHPHTDHMGSLSDILRSYDIGQVYFTNHSEDLTPTNATYAELLRTLADTKTPTMITTTGLTVELDTGTITVAYDPVNNDLNNCSMVLRYEYGGTSFLFMGDAEGTVEKQMIEYDLVKQTDVLKAGHHGSKKATTSPFLEAVDPEYAVISCGADNDYGYPKEEVLARLEQAGADVVRTDTMGDIVFISDGSRLRLWNAEQEAA